MGSIVTEQYNYSFCTLATGKQRNTGMFFNRLNSDRLPLYTQRMSTTVNSSVIFISTIFIALISGSHSEKVKSCTDSI